MIKFVNGVSVLALASACFMAKGDTVEGSQGTDTVEGGGSGTDTVEGSQGTDTVEGAASGDVVSTGVRARRAFMLKQFLPAGEFINTQVVAKGKGFRMVVGRIYGQCTSTARKENTLPDGKVVQSVVCNGSFESESYLDGEIGRATSVYFPMAYAEMIETAFKGNKDLLVVEVDCDIGLEATGKTIPYEWVVIAFREGQEMDALKRIKAGRGRPENAPALPAPNKALPAS